MFKFSLETALDVRSREEKIQMKTLAEKLAAEKQIQDLIDGILSSIEKADQEMNQCKQAGTFSIQQMKYLNAYKEKAEVDLKLHYQELEAAKQEVAKQQEVLLECSKKRKTLEILKEREEKRYQEKLARLERNFMDEVAGNLFFQPKSF